MASTQDVAASETQMQPAEKVTLATSSEEQVYTASQWQLMWWRFRRHKMAIVSAIVLILLYLVALFCEFVAPHEAHRYEARLALAPPRPIHLWDPEAGRPALFVYGVTSSRDPVSYAKVFEVDKAQKLPIRFFVRGDPYKLWGAFPADVHLFGLERGQGMLLLLGADDMGRDVLSRILYGARISLSIGLVGVSLSMILGILLGGVSGYYGGIADITIQRIIEFLRSLPGIPLWLTLAAALPADWPPIRVYFGITVILSLLGWTGLARVVRGRFLALREEDFVLAAKLAGANELRIILAHMVPSFASHLIASLTLSIPAMILSETSLSFLGLGLQAPIISWGVLLQTAQNLRSVATAPWLLLPGLAVVVAVLAFNFVGDGLRDAADPYSR
jgi:peptide/nickel transport system permease protein